MVKLGFTWLPAMSKQRRLGTHEHLLADRSADKVHLVVYPSSCDHSKVMVHTNCRQKIGNTVECCSHSELPVILEKVREISCLTLEELQQLRRCQKSYLIYMNSDRVR